MMNLEKMKQKKSKNGVKKGLLAATTIFCLASPVLQMQSVYAAENTTPAITIEKPDGWKQGETTVSITVDASHMPEGFTVSKIEAKAGKDGSWQDVTGSGSISITGNQTVYVRVTDGDGKVYEQNRSIKCYDTEKPTLSASLTDGVLTIQGNDTVSGISAITVNGTTYTDLTDGMLRVQLTQKDFTTKQIEITVTDGAGNISEKYVLQNPYYEWAVKQAEKQKSSSESSDGMTTATSTDTTTAETTTSPLPQDAQASEATDAKGTVDERTVTGIEEQLAEEGETAETVTKTGTEDTKEFYTISTKSGKIFYLIVDNSKSQDNVYFLTEVSEKDLMNFTLSDTVTLPEVDTVYAEPESKTEEETQPETTETPEDEKEEEEVQMPEDKNPIGTYLLIGLVAVGAVAGGYYFKVYKPKHEYDDEDEMEEDESEDSESEKREVDDVDVQESETEPEQETKTTQDAEFIVDEEGLDVLPDEEEDDDYFLDD